MTWEGKVPEGMGNAGKGQPKGGRGASVPTGLHGKLTEPVFFGENNGGFSLRQDRMKAKSTRAE